MFRKEKELTLFKNVLSYKIHVMNDLMSDRRRHQLILEKRGINYIKHLPQE